MQWPSIPSPLTPVGAVFEFLLVSKLDGGAQNVLPWVSSTLSNCLACHKEWSSVGASLRATASICTNTALTPNASNDGSQHRAAIRFLLAGRIAGFLCKREPLMQRVWNQKFEQSRSRVFLCTAARRLRAEAVWKPLCAGATKPVIGSIGQASDYPPFRSTCRRSLRRNRLLRRRRRNWGVSPFC